MTGERPGGPGGSGGPGGPGGPVLPGGPGAPGGPGGPVLPGGPGGQGAGSIESLYPFLYPGTGDAGTTGLAAVLEEVRRSTVAKAEEIMELRRVISARDGDQLMSCAADVAARFTAGGRLLAFGNGGSATDAQELVTLFLNPGFGVRPLPALGLASDISVVTALGNDVGVDVVFARQIAAFGRRCDIAVGLSTSGNSENLLRAFDEATRRGLLTIGFAGYQGGKMAELDSIDYLFVAPSSSVHRIQEAQTTVYHVLWELTLAALTAAPSATTARATPTTATPATPATATPGTATPATATPATPATPATATPATPATATSATPATALGKLDGAEVSR
jgi:D-sedoheptulose 7-phosphate isomerase